MTLYLREDIREQWGDEDAFDRIRSLTGRVFREEPGRRTLQFELGGRRYFLKHHRGVGWREIIKNLLQLRRPVTGAQNEWRALRELRELGIATLTPAGFGERGDNPARRESFLISDALEDTVSLETVCARWPAEPPSPAFRRRLVAELARISRRLHDAGVFHRDYYLCHFLLACDAQGRVAQHAGPRPVLIDLHRALIRPSRPGRWKVKDIAGLYYSALGAGLRRRDRLRFMRHYSGGLRQALGRDRLFWRAVEKRAMRLARRERERWLERWRKSGLRQSLPVPGDVVSRHWSAVRPEAREQVLHMLVSQIAQAHCRGILPAESAVEDARWREDGVAIEHIGGPALPADSDVARRSRHENLAAWLAWFPAEADEYLPLLQRHYRECLAAAGRGADSGEEPLEWMVFRYRQQRWLHRRKTLYRGTLAHRRRSSWSRLAIYERAIEGEQLQQFIHSPEPFIRRGHMLKDGDSTTVAALELDGREYVVKRYNLLGFRHGLSRLLRPSRAWRCWAAGHMLSLLGLRTPRPVLMLEARWGPLRRQAWILMEAVPGEDVLHSLAGEPVNSAPWRRALAQFSRLFRVMRRHHVVHGDLKASNFISREDALVILDLDATRQMRPGGRFERAFRRDLRRFIRNWTQQAGACEATAELAEQFGLEEDTRDPQV